MSRRITPLSASQIAELLDASSESSACEDETSSESGEEEDILHQEVEEERGEEDDEQEQPSQVTLKKLTRSQTVLAEAEFRTEPPSDAGPYEASYSGTTVQWSTSNTDTTRRRRGPANILTESAGVRGHARNAAMELEAFHLFVTTDIMEDIIKRTNAKLEQVRKKKEEKLEEQTWKKHAHRYQPVTMTEMLAFTGICVLRSFFTDLTLKQIYDAKLGPPAFKATMGASRYGTLLRYITFDDATLREERRKGDKFCLIRDIFERFDASLRAHFSPSECMTIDESLLRFRGRCSFRM